MLIQNEDVCVHNVKVRIIEENNRVREDNKYLQDMMMSKLTLTFENVMLIRHQRDRNIELNQ